VHELNKLFINFSLSFSSFPLESAPETHSLILFVYFFVCPLTNPLCTLKIYALQVEEGLAELHHEPGLLPSPSSRFPYFPQVSK
jgi:hypothetical protein